MNNKPKTEYDAYLRSRRYVNFVGRSVEILEIFGYSKTTHIRTIKKIRKFIRPVKYKHPAEHWEIRNLAAIDSNVIKKGIFFNSIYGPSAKKLFLVPRNLVPFYLLKEYGGEII